MDGLHRDASAHLVPAASARRLARAATVVLLALLAAACQSKAGADPEELPGGGPNVEAKLAGIGGSVAGGSAFLSNVRGGVNISIWIGSTGPGEYRVAIHENGLCNSANGFSAGPPWSPPGVPVAVVLLRKNDDTRTLNAFMPGYRVQGPRGVMGRSVIVHDGASGSLEAQPGVRNNRIACGVVGTPEDLFPRLGF